MVERENTNDRRRQSNSVVNLILLSLDKTLGKSGALGPVQTNHGSRKQCFSLALIYNSLVYGCSSSILRIRVILESWFIYGVWAIKLTRCTELISRFITIQVRYVFTTVGTTGLGNIVSGVNSLAALTCSSINRLVQPWIIGYGTHSLPKIPGN